MKIFDLSPQAQKALPEQADCYDLAVAFIRQNWINQGAVAAQR